MEISSAVHLFSPKSSPCSSPPPTIISISFFAPFAIISIASSPPHSKSSPVMLLPLQSSPSLPFPLFPHVRLRRLEAKRHNHASHELEVQWNKKNRDLCSFVTGA
ncbi:hypothetical protein SLEP1_g21259 [Rubroshorea leprosula]|uniref:Uncharacterized protein n=1 Tax=Rubroshorea leprosula TaxID=152421 RepID=A0AAV5J5C5_9ROSI|nr:hypothetical protein SLEP1_g21259 [Rubroshorea leprosula]